MTGIRHNNLFKLIQIKQTLMFPRCSISYKTTFKDLLFMKALVQRYLYRLVRNQHKWQLKAGF